MPLILFILSGVGAIVGIVSLIKPLRQIGVRSRGVAVRVLAGSFIIFAMGATVAAHQESGSAAAQPEQKITAPAGYQAMELVDLKVDIHSLAGKKVATQGVLQVLGEVAMIKSDAMDTTGLFIGIDKLPRDARKTIVTDCQTYCRVNIAGTVQETDPMHQIVAEQIAFR